MNSHTFALSSRPLPHLRWAMPALVALLLALAVRWVWIDQQSHRQQAADAEIVALVAQQWALTQQAARPGESVRGQSVAVPDAPGLQELVQLTKRRVARVQALAPSPAPGRGAAPDDLKLVQRQWVAAQQLLVYRAETLPASGEGDEPAAAAARREFQRQADAAAVASQTLLTRLQQQAQVHERPAVGETAPIVLAALAGIGLLTLRRAARPSAVVADAPEAAAALPAQPSAVPALLMGRSAAQWRLQRTLEHAARYPGYGFAALALSLQEFDPAPQTLGEGAALLLAREIANRLLTTVRPGDAVAQLETTDGSQRYAVILEGVSDDAQLCAITERLLAEMAEAYTVLDHPVHGRLHVALLDAAQAGGDAQAVLHDVELTLDEAGRRRESAVLRFEPALRERQHRAQALQSQLQQALAQHELALRFEPVVDLATGAPVGVQAELFWDHPERGWLDPAELTAEAESAGCAGLMADIALRQALHRFAAWRTRGAAAPRWLSLGLAAGQLERGDFVPGLQALLDGCGVAPGELELALCEDRVVDAAARQSLAALRDLGVRLMLMGLGGSTPSLQALQQLPVHTVLIDKGFVAQATEVEAHEVLIRAIVSLASASSIDTRAAGVTTAEQAQLLRSIGVTQAAGPAWAVPMRVADFERWAAESVKT